MIENIDIADISETIEMDGGAVMKIDDNIKDKINELITYETDLIDRTKIINTVIKYINNYTSPEYKKYKDELNKLYLLIGKKGYIEYNKNMIYLKKKDGTILYHVKKPEYIYVDKELKEVENDIYTIKNNLDIIFNKLKNPQNRSKDNIKEFEKLKLNYKKLLEDKEIIRIYDIIINQKDVNTEYIKIMYNFINNDDNIKNLDGKLYNVPKNIINEINESRANRLIQFNEIIENVDKSKKIDKNQKKNIVDYLTNKEIDILKQKINNIVNLQNNKVNYIIKELPKVY